MCCHWFLWHGSLLFKAFLSLNIILPIFHKRCVVTFIWEECFGISRKQFVWKQWVIVKAEIKQRQLASKYRSRESFYFIYNPYHVRCWGKIHWSTVVLSAIYIPVMTRTSHFSVRLRAQAKESNSSQVCSKLFLTKSYSFHTLTRRAATQNLLLQKLWQISTFPSHLNMDCVINNMHL